MNKDVNEWARCCQQCQKSKVIRQTITPIGKFPEAGRFEHLDIVGSFPPSRNMRYIVTMVDRYTRWPEAIPVEDITAEMVATAFYEGWVCRFGVPSKLTTDQGRQFESELFIKLTNILGTERIRTTSYHPQANGMMERWHRSLKSALMAHLKDECYYYLR